MKKTFLYGAMLCSLSLVAQQQQEQKTCGFEQELQLQDRTLPGIRQMFDKIIGNIQAQRQSDPLSAAKGMVNGVYEIPVVVHVIEGNNPSYTRTDAQIQQWLENANKMYAGTYPWPASGLPADFGTSAVFPIKLVLAKRDPNCNATTGIVRYNGSTLSGYNTSGMAYQTTSGASRAAIKGLAPHWPEASYFNIYVITTFDGSTTPNAGLMGFAAFPNNLDSNYESFMKTGVVTKAHDTTFAHEFGHAMGLYHTFQGGRYDAVPADSDFCPPTTGVCDDDDDQVCDTERSGSGYYAWPVPSNSAINSCTGTNYQGVQYNMMNYSNSVAQKFTAGQGQRINDSFMLLRSSLTTSKAGTALPATPAPSVVPAVGCVPPSVQNPGNYLVGPVSVKLGQIDNASPGYWAAHPYYYVDYTTKACTMKIYTPLVVNQSQTIDVGIFGNPQFVRVWIDYNNNGTFEANELVASGDDVAIGADGNGTFTGTFTPPATATLNTPLRMRVIADAESPSSYAPCGQLGYGQAEDYSVMLVNNLATSEVKVDNTDLAIYPNPVATGDNVFIKAKDGKNLKVSISDMSGRLVASPSVTEEGNGVYKVNQQLEKGVYMVQISNGKDSKTSKLIIK
ncbi:Por secretion system C-terminal sorting domain-containing protein [Chryseobacterium oranimense]|uniref:Por secretion system C-terminal sorting domain-containing protein n=1 Tax=Chryseobacterium oranimense TaxID=421058 RepID=A0A1M5WY07_9FLAO|nr:GEVED domain-containing protein [Chryseobacterium oranimense]SHH92391.1 Por secretion system C-terminal sorting domain-containing protein [Chryseobacterium oranimense]